MNKTRIEWAHYSWNPIKGMCPVGCWYCYARRMYQRFKWDKEIRLDMSVPIERYGRIPDGSRIFVCSTFEMFHPSIPAHYRDYIFGEIKDYKKLTFIILTKLPSYIDWRQIPDNLWLGVSVEGIEQWHRVHELLTNNARIKFISLEPFLGRTPNICDHDFDWLIIGALTGHGKGYYPETAAIEYLVDSAKEYRIPVFLKNNLVPIMGTGYIKAHQEWPKEPTHD